MITRFNAYLATGGDYSKYRIVFSKRKLKKIFIAVLHIIKNKEHDKYFESAKTFGRFIDQLKEDIHPMYWDAISVILSSIKFIKFDGRIRIWLRPDIDNIIDSYYGGERKNYIILVDEFYSTKIMLP